MVLLYSMFSCVFVTFPYGIVGQLWYLIVSIPGLCLLPYYDDIPMDVITLRNDGPSVT